MKLSVCAEMMYRELDFPQRAKKIKACGFDAIEFWQWRNKDMRALKCELERLDMKVSAFCVDSTDDTTAARLARNALNTGNEHDLISAALESIERAKFLNCEKLIITVGNRAENFDIETQLENAERNLKLLGGIFEEHGMTLLCEPINRTERPTYLLPNAKDAAELVRRVNSPGVKLLYDVYHQSMENDFDVSEMAELADITGHVHIADCPGRNEPGSGVTDFTAVAKTLSRTDYSGYVGLEFMPKNGEERAFNAVKKIFCPELA